MRERPSATPCDSFSLTCVHPCSDSGRLASSIYGILSVWQSYTISRAFSAFGTRLCALYSRRPLYASNEAIADSLGHGDESKNSETVGVLDRRMLWHR